MPSCSSAGLGPVSGLRWTSGVAVETVDAPLRRAAEPHAERLSAFGRLTDRPVVVGGSPRSGTTLLRTMLHCHPELAVPRETRFVIEAWDRRRRFGDLREEANRARLGRWIFKRKRTRADRFGLDPDAAIERLKAAPPTLGSLLATCFVMYAEKEGKPRWGDKRPKYAARMTAVWDLFPSAQFVHVVRDPRACVASMRKLGWYEGNIAPAVELWERSLNTVNAWRGKLAADQLLELRYEDLIAEPEATLVRVVDFAHMAGSSEALEQMLEYHKHEETRSERYHANVARPLDPSRVSSWSEALEPAEISFVENAVRPLMLQYGYEPAAEAIAPPDELVRSLARCRKRSAAARWKLAWTDRIQKVLTHRRPLAAELRAE
jgi:hypothetical protein